MIQEIHDLLKFLIDLAVYHSASLSEISLREGLSQETVKKISEILIQHQLIEKDDQLYKLNKSDKDYIISDVIKEVFHSFMNIKCLKGENNCSQFETCSLNCFWYGMEKAVLEYVDEYTLEDLKKGYCFN